jgi:hypothetical protein
LPHISVAYPTSESACAIVTSQRVNPSGPPVIGTVCVPERCGWRPVSSAERDGVHCASCVNATLLRQASGGAHSAAAAPPQFSPNCLILGGHALIVTTNCLCER